MKTPFSLNLECKGQFEDRLSSSERHIDLLRQSDTLSSLLGFLNGSRTLKGVTRVPGRLNVSSSSLKMKTRQTVPVYRGNQPTFSKN